MKLLQKESKEDYYGHMIFHTKLIFIKNVNNSCQEDLNSEVSKNTLNSFCNFVNLTNNSSRKVTP